MTGRDTLPDGGATRRQWLTGLGGAILGFGGGIILNGVSFPSKELPTYVARQGKLRWELEPLSYKDWTVREAYAYDDGGLDSANFPADISKTENASRVFTYDGPVDDSLVFYHGSTEASSGGTAFFKFSGLKRSKGDWAVRDDPMGVDNDFEKWEGGNAKVKWQWGAGESDGGAYWGVLDQKDFSIKIYPKELTGVDQWNLLTYVPNMGIRRHQLSTSDALYIEDPKRPVRTINMEIMPGTDPNVFDPYEKGSMTVALKSGGEVSPKDLDPGNYSLSFGSHTKLAGGNAAQPQKTLRKNGKILLEFNTKAAGFELGSDYGYLMTKSTNGAWVRGRDTVMPGGFNSSSSNTPNLVLLDYQADPAGDDTKNLNEEWIKLQNADDNSIDLTAWTVHDADGNTYQFPDGFVLDAKTDVTLHTGSGTDSTTDLYWGKGTPVWTNGGDRIIVENGSGNMVINFSYPQS